MDAEIRRGRIALDDGEPGRALEIADQLLARDAGDVAALGLAADAHALLHNERQMADCHARVLRLDPAAEASYVALADLFANYGRGERLDALLRQATRHCPDSVELHWRMGKHLSEQNRLAAGEWHFRRALARDDGRADVLAMLALNLLKQGRSEEADATYAAAHAARPDDADLLAHWAHVAEQRGDLAAARERLAQARASDRRFDLLRAAIHLRAGETDAALAAIGDGPDVNGDAMLARGRIRERLGDYAAAWRDYSDGKARLAKAERVPDYEADAVSDLFARLESLATPSLLADLPAAATRGDVPQPLFITGAPRSGTTLLEQVLAMHSAIVPGGELTFAGEFRELLQALVPEAPFPENVAYVKAGDRHYVATLLRDYYLARAAEAGLTAGDHRYFTDKMPWNETWLPLIRMAFPGSPVLHLHRNPADAAISIFANKLNHGFYCGYGIESIARHLHATARLFRHYRDVAGLAADEMSYERFVADQEGETRRLLDRLGLPFEAACLDFHVSPRVAPTPSYAQVAEPVHDRSIGRARHFAEQLAPFARWLANGAS